MRAANGGDAFVESRSKDGRVLVQSNQRKCRAESKPGAPARHKAGLAGREQGPVRAQPQRQSPESAKDASAAARARHLACPCVTGAAGELLTRRRTSARTSV